MFKCGQYPYSKNAVKYVCKTSLPVKGLSYTLFNVQPTVSWYIQEEAKKDSRVRDELEKINRNNAEEAQHFLEEIKALMGRLGKDEELNENRYRDDSYKREKLVILDLFYTVLGGYGAFKRRQGFEPNFYIGNSS